MRRAGHRAYIGSVPGLGANDAERWRAHIEGPDGRMVEQVDGEPADLVAWARQRTGWVLVLPATGSEDVFAWAGSDPKPDDVPRYWSG